MTAHRDLKDRIRDRQAKTGESYMAARAHVMRERAVLLGLSGEPTLAPPARVTERSARLRILGEAGQVTFRLGDVWDVVPGQLVTLIAEKTWTWKGDAYASGRIENPRIDLAKLGLVPLPLHDGRLEDLRAIYESYKNPDPYAPLWRTFTAEPRPCYEMDPIAWGAFPDADPKENPTCDAAELIEAGDRAGARELLMDALLRDLRCIDAHAHLGNLAFDRAPEEAVLHYEVGVRIFPRDSKASCRGACSTIGRSSAVSTATGCASGGSGVSGKPRRSSSATCP